MVALVLPASAIAQTVIDIPDGTVIDATEEIWPAGATVNVYGSLEITLTGELTIEPGVTVNLLGGYANLTVRGTLTIHEGVTFLCASPSFFTVSAGTLNVLGTGENPVTFTSSLPNPTCGTWPGIQIRDSQALIFHAIIEHAQRGIDASESYLTVENTTIRHMCLESTVGGGTGIRVAVPLSAPVLRHNTIEFVGGGKGNPGRDGSNGSAGTDGNSPVLGHGEDGTNGGAGGTGETGAEGLPAYGIHLERTESPLVVEFNVIRHIVGGEGGDGGQGGRGGNGGRGGDGSGGLTGGWDGGNGGQGGPSGNGGNGGPGGTAFGILMQNDTSRTITISHNLIYDVRGGRGGRGGDTGATAGRGGNGGDGGDGLSPFTNGGDGGNGGNGGNQGRGGNGGPGGAARGVSIDPRGEGLSPRITFNTIAHILPGEPGEGGAPGTPGERGVRGLGGIGGAGGSNGAPGTPGSPGSPGAPGTTGPPGVSHGVSVSALGESDFVNNVIAFGDPLSGSGIQLDRLEDLGFHDGNAIFGFFVAYSVGFTPGPYEIFVDPLFVDPENGNFRLLYGSPCIDGASPVTETGTVDLDGNFRPIDIDGWGTDGSGDAFDIGAYEFITRADRNHDGTLDGNDVFLMSRQWRSNVTVEEDINDDGFFDHADLQKALERWKGTSIRR